MQIEAPLSWQPERQRSPQALEPFFSGQSCAVEQT
jgi:hypothetical protein